MNRANVSYTRNHLSEMLARVKAGETILIVDRQRPVARLEPATGVSEGRTEWQESLVRRGLLRPARHRIDLKALAAMPLPVAEGGDILEALLAEREEGR